MSVFHTSEFVGLHGLTMYEDGASKLLIGPERGTYGGFSGCESIAQMEAMLAYAPHACTIKLAPASHDLQLFSRSMNVLHRAGFMLAHVDLNYDMPVGNINLAERLADGARKKLSKCERANFHSRKLDAREWRNAYKLIAANRERAGRTLSVPFQQIEALEAALPGTHWLFGTFDGDRMIAAAICLRVREDVLYVYAWGDAEKNEYAPTVHLCRCIYEECCFDGDIRLLDAGISSVAGVPNEGLMRFKTSLGFTVSAKVTMERK